MVMKKISEGAEACIYLLEGHKAVHSYAFILKYRQKKNYRVKELDEALRMRRTRIEARALYAAHIAGINVPILKLAGRYEILTSYVKGKMLKDLLYMREKPNGAIRKAGEYLAKLHNIDIAHGDYTPANIIVAKNNVYIIDFGLAVFTKSIEDKALDMLLMKRSLDSKQFGYFLSGYKTYSNNYSIMVKRLDEIERRGRYQTRTLITNS